MGINAGKLDQLVHLMELTATATGWAWTERRKAWARAEPSDRVNIFSSVGIGARTVKFTIRRQSIDLTCAVVWNGQHCFITAVDPTEDKVHLAVTAAVVTVVSCIADAHKTPQGVTFPAVLTEKYIRHEQREPYAVNAVCYVLVAPKAVTMQAGGLVDVAGTAYQVLCAHTLDPYKNEFEIMRTADL